MLNTPLLPVGAPVTPNLAVVENTPTAPTPESIERFQNALAPNTEPRVINLEHVRHTPITNAPGDVILKGLEQIREEYLSRKQGMNDFLRGKQSPTPAELVRIQFDLLMASFYVDWVSKVASKTTQNLDTLLKSQ